MFNGGLFLLATAYEKLISRFDALGFLRGWIFAVLMKPAVTPAERLTRPGHASRPVPPPGQR